MLLAGVLASALHAALLQLAGFASDERLVGFDRATSVPNGVALYPRGPT